MFSRIDDVIDEHRFSDVRVASLAFDGQADADSRREQGGCLGQVTRRRPQVEPHRIELLDRDQLGQAGIADQVAHFDLQLADSSVDRSVHLAVAQVDLGIIQVGLGPA